MIQFIMDMETKNKDTESFLAALVKECKKRNIKYDVITKKEEFDCELPYVIMEPNDMVKKWGPLSPILDCDCDATARVIKDRIINYSPSGGCEVLLIGRGKVVGLPTANLLLLHTNCQLTIVNSWVGIESLADKMRAAEVIVNTSTSKIMADMDLSDKLIIDVNNNLHFRCTGDRVPYRLDQRNIGIETVRKILDRYEFYNADEGDDCTILHDKKEDNF